MPKNKIIAFILILIFLVSLILYGINTYQFIKSLPPLGPNSTRSFSLGFYLDPLIYVFELLAILQFILSKFKRSALLRILLQYKTFSFFIFFPIWTINSFFIDNLIPTGLTDFWFYLRYAISLCSAVFNIFALLYLMSSLKPKLIPLGNGNHTFDEVRPLERFFHRILDLIVVTFAIYPSFEYILRFLMKILDGSTSSFSPIWVVFQSREFIYIFISGSTLLYYLIIESIFNTSIGKTILGNVIINNVAEQPSVKQRVGRTFARLIPFDAISFLAISRGWHDSLTQTYLVKGEKIADIEPGEINPQTSR